MIYLDPYTKVNMLVIIKERVQYLPGAGGKSEHRRTGYFLTESLGNGKLAPQKQTAGYNR